MKQKLLSIKISLIVILATANVHSELTGLELMEKQKEIHQNNNEIVTSTMTIIDKKGREKDRQIISYSMKKEDGLSKTMIKFKSPANIKNVGLLTWEQGEDKDDDQWFYLPAMKKVKRIVSGGKKNTFMGTDFSFEDMRPENVKAHTYTILREEKINGHACYVVEALPATDKEKKDSGYSKRIVWVRKDITFGIKSEFYDKRGKKFKVSSSEKLENIKGQMWRANLSIMENLKRNTKTKSATNERKLDKHLDDTFFTQRNLKKAVEQL